MCIAVLNKTGRPMWVITILDGVMALNFGLILVVGLFTEPDGMTINLGEYLTIPPLPTVFLLLLVFALPLAASTIWAYRRRRQTPPSQGPTTES